MAKLELGLIQAFGAKMFNWSCLLNNSWKNYPPKKFMHYHVRPRYDVAVNFSGKTFIDSDFSSHYNLDLEKALPKRDFDKNFRQKIIQQIQKYIKV